MRKSTRCHYKPILVALAFTCTTLFTAASATELVGRVVDNVDARVFFDATVALRGNGVRANEAGADQLRANDLIANNQPANNVRANLATPLVTRTDKDGFFRLSDIQPGAYLVDISLADGRILMSRLIIHSKRKTQFLELDYSRAVPPDDHDDY